MSDQYTTRTSRNYFQRLGDSLGGTLIGIVLVLVSIGLLAWNESRAINAIRGLDTGARSAISLPSGSVAATNEGRLIHVTGTSATGGPLDDPITGASVANALILTRQVEMYQWTETSKAETRDKVGGTQETVTTYTYARGWSDEAQDSTRFAQPQGRTNPPMELSSGRIQSTSARLGAFALGGKLLDRLNPETPVQLTSAPDGWRLVAGGLYRGTGTPEAPQIGDLRISYLHVPAGGPLSVMGRQTGGEITGWTDNRQGYEVLLVAQGTLSIGEMVKTEKAAEGVLTWVLRVLGIALCCGGFALILGPLSALGNVVPLVASILGAGTGLVAFGLGTGLSLTVIAIAWFAVRPLVSAGLIAGAIAIWWFTKGKRKQPAAAPAV
ncbi:MAG: TMEM43 family protein [Hyphomonadaceae bacterium]|jgi:hypothetical protein|nr:TMEM43 family protein [Hyphomonadaceae bacterium]